MDINFQTQTFVATHQIVYSNMKEIYNITLKTVYPNVGYGKQATCVI